MDNGDGLFFGTKSSNWSSSDNGVQASMPGGPGGGGPCGRCLASVYAGSPPAENSKAQVFQSAVAETGHLGVAAGGERRHQRLPPRLGVALGWRGCRFQQQGAGGAAAAPRRW